MIEILGYAAAIIGWLICWRLNYAFMQRAEFYRYPNIWLPTDKAPLFFGAFGPLATLILFTDGVFAYPRIPNEAKLLGDSNTKRQKEIHKALRVLNERLNQQKNG